MTISHVQVMLMGMSVEDLNVAIVAATANVNVRMDGPVKYVNVEVQKCA